MTEFWSIILPNYLSVNGVHIEGGRLRKMAVVSGSGSIDPLPIT